MEGTREQDIIIRALREENVAQRKQLAEAYAQIRALTQQVNELATLVAQGNERISELLAIAQRKQRTTRSKATTQDIAPPTPPASLDEDAKKRFENRPRPPELPKKKKPPKKKQRPTGRKPVPQHLEPETHNLKPPACEHCGSDDLQVVDQVLEEKLHVVKEHQRRRVTVRKTCACNQCGGRTTARALPSPFPRSKATCEWLAWLIHTHFVLLVPLDRIRRDLSSRGIKLAMSYFVTQLERAADILGPVDGEHWKQLLASEWMAMDATGLKVLIPELSGSHNGYIEAFRNNEVVVFQYEPHKGSDELVAKLNAFKGILVADAEHRHNAVFASGAVTEAGCNAHGRRKFRDAEGQQPALAAEGGAFISAIYKTETDACKAGLTGAALRKWRREKVPPLKNELRDWMDAVEPGLTPNDDLAKVIRYYRRHWDALFRFVDHPEIPIDNSETEREFQNVAKLRHNRLFAGSTEGAHRFATLMGIVATCRKLDINAQAYLAWAFTRFGTHRDVFGRSAAEVTPAAFKTEQASNA